jgi:hypothetical protein
MIALSLSAVDPVTGSRVARGEDGTMQGMSHNHLSLVVEVEIHDWEDGKYLRRPESYSLDLVIDGIPLRDRVAGTENMVTDLSRAWLPDVAEAVEVLKGRKAHPYLDAERVALLVCEVCGDLGCGAVTARRSVTDYEVQWTEWRWTDFTGERPAVSPSGEPVTSFAFDRGEYEAALDESMDRLAGLPYDELAHKGKRFLWPWEWGWRLP